MTHFVQSHELQTMIARFNSRRDKAKLESLTMLLDSSITGTTTVKKKPDASTLDPDLREEAIQKEMTQLQRLQIYEQVADSEEISTICSSLNDLNLQGSSHRLDIQLGYDHVSISDLDTPIVHPNRNLEEDLQNRLHLQPT